MGVTLSHVMLRCAPVLPGQKQLLTDRVEHRLRRAPLMPRNRRQSLPNHALKAQVSVSKANTPAVAMESRPYHLLVLNKKLFLITSTS